MRTYVLCSSTVGAAKAHPMMAQPRSCWAHLQSDGPPQSHGISQNRLALALLHCNCTVAATPRHRHTQSPSRAVPHGTQLRMLRRCCGATVPRQGDAWLPHVQNLEQLGPLSKRRLRKRERASFQAHGQSRLCVTRSWSPYL